MTGSKRESLQPCFPIQTSSRPTMTSIIAVKGYADLLVAVLLAISPSAIYNNPITRAVGSFSGLVCRFSFWSIKINHRVQHISDAAATPGFNQDIACKTAAVGVGNIAASRSGPAVTLSIYLGVLSIATCVASRELGIATGFWMI